MDSDDEGEVPPLLGIESRPAALRSATQRFIWVNRALSTLPSLRGVHRAPSTA